MPLFYLSFRIIIWRKHYSDVIMTAIASQITSLTIVYSNVYSDADQRNYESPASLAFVWGIHRGPVNSPHKGPVTRKMFPFDDVIMFYSNVPASTYLCIHWQPKRHSDSDRMPCYFLFGAYSWDTVFVCLFVCLFWVGFFSFFGGGDFFLVFHNSCMNAKVTIKWRVYYAENV